MGLKHQLMVHSLSPLNINHMQQTIEINNTGLHEMNAAELNETNGGVVLAAVGIFIVTCIALERMGYIKFLNA